MYQRMTLSTILTELSWKQVGLENRNKRKYNSRLWAKLSFLLMSLRKERKWDSVDLANSCPLLVGISYLNQTSAHTLERQRKIWLLVHSLLYTFWTWQGISCSGVTNLTLQRCLKLDI